MYEITGGDQEVIRLEFIYKSGRWSESVPGVAHFTASQLNKGAAGLTSFAIAEGFDKYGAHFDVTPGLDATIVSVYTLTRFLKPVLDLTLLILSQPELPEAELEVSKSIFLQNLKINSEKTGFLASRKFKEILFGAQHPYGRELDESSILNMNRADLGSHFTKTYGDFFLIVSGKASSADLAMIRQAVSQLPYKLNPEVTHKSPVAASAQSFYEAKAGSVQTSIRMGRLFLDRTHPDYGKALLLNHIFGGYFGSRLMKNIREEKGLTYGIHSSINAQVKASFLLIGADVNAENKSEAIHEIRLELKRLATEAIPDAELITARNHFIGSLQGELTTTFSHAEKIRSLILNQLPNNFYQHLINDIDRTTAADLQQLATEWFDDTAFLEVSIG